MLSVRLEETMVAHVARPERARRIRHIIWDWNGTLLDDARACAAAVDALMRRRGLAGETACIENNG